MENTYQVWLWQKLGDKCLKALKNHGFDAHFVPNGEEARKLTMEIISGYETFGFGGSSTTRSLGILDELTSSGKTIYDHWPKGHNLEEDIEIRLQQGRCDCFLCSANAISAGLASSFFTIWTTMPSGCRSRASSRWFGSIWLWLCSFANDWAPTMASCAF